MDRGRRGALLVEQQDVAAELGDLQSGFNELAAELERLSQAIKLDPQDVVFFKDGHSMGNTPLGKTVSFQINLADRIANLPDQIADYRDKRKRSLEIQRKLFGLNSSA